MHSLVHSLIFEHVWASGTVLGTDRNQSSRGSVCIATNTSRHLCASAAPGLLGGLSEKKEEMRSEPVTEKIFVTIVSVVFRWGLRTAALHCVPSVQAAMAPAHPTQLLAALLPQRKTTRPSPCGRTPRIRNGNESPLFPLERSLSESFLRWTPRTNDLQVC